ncbi:MAG TPA: hypothetical protein VGD81_00785 [Opitutaceae bacterium]
MQPHAANHVTNPNPNTLRHANLPHDRGPLPVLAKPRRLPRSAAAVAGLATLLTVTPSPAQTGSSGAGSAVVPLSSVVADDDGISAPFSLGAMGIIPEFTYRYTQADDLRARDGETRSTVIQDFSPGVIVLLGDKWTFGYRPTWRVYSDEGFVDRVNHYFNLDGATTYNDWHFALSQDYLSSEQSLAETGRQTGYDYFGTSFIFGAPINSKLGFEVETRQDMRFTDEFVDYRQWDGTAWVDYYIGPGLKVGVGAGASYVSVDPGADMSVTHGLVRLGVQATRKIELDLRTGVESRDFRSGDRSNLSNTLLGLSLTYRPLETTTLTLGAGRDVSASYFRGLVTERERLSATLRQRLFGRLYLTLGVVEENTDYVSTETSQFEGREDERSIYSVGLSTSVFTRTRLAIFYRQSENSSNLSDFEYTSDQFGFEVSIR